MIVEFATANLANDSASRSIPDPDPLRYREESVRTERKVIANVVRFISKHYEVFRNCANERVRSSEERFAAARFFEG